MVTSIHKNKKLPMKYNAWVVVAEGTCKQDQDTAKSSDGADGEELRQNLFMDSDMVIFQCNVTPIDWIPESQYRVPAAGKDSLPATAEARSMSEVQEAAQLLGGRHMPTQVLRSLVSGTALEMGAAGAGGNPLLTVINLTPYEGCLEMAAMNLKEVCSTTPSVRTLSVSTDPTLVQCSQTTCAVKLLQDASLCPGSCVSGCQGPCLAQL
jgi:hypothetical protein